MTQSHLFQAYSRHHHSRFCCCGWRRDADGLWSAFLSYLEAAPGDDEQELATLEKQLREVKQELADKRYLQGNSNISAADLALV